MGNPLRSPFFKLYFACKASGQLEHFKKAIYNKSDVIEDVIQFVEAPSYYNVFKFFGL